MFFRNNIIFASLTQSISNKLHLLTERDSRLAHYFAQLWGLELHLGYLAISGAKSDVIFLLSDPDFSQQRRNFARMSGSFWDLTRDRQTTDAATETEGSHTKCVSLINPKMRNSIPFTHIHQRPLNGCCRCWVSYFINAFFTYLHDTSSGALQQQWPNNIAATTATATTTV